jgi:hypothetical protein
MAVASSRPRNTRSQMQVMLGTRATVLERIEHTSPNHRMVGWWAAVHYAEPDCGCGWCISAQEEREHYIGWSVRDAIVEISDYVRVHEPDDG